MADYLLLLLGMGLVTCLPRWLPSHYLSRRSLSEWFIQWLELIPAAILSALLPALILDGEPRCISWPPATRVVSGPADVCFCLVDAVIGWHSGCWDAAVLVGGKGGPAVVCLGGMKQKPKCLKR